ncbi:hypothetical protein C0995_007230 [Termitomyces sp. Mi166|nr:hypothetical protein C0995_007230 [Termitomyces sp. Mi166\
MSSENYFPAGTGPCGIALAELSYVHVKKVPRRDSNAGRTSRSPMIDRLNHASRVEIANTVTTSPAPWATSRLLSLPNLTQKIGIKSRNQESTASSSLVPIAAKTRLAQPLPVMHPNNPYVPWTPETRREILYPLATFLPGVSSNTCNYSHITLHLEPASHRVGHRPSEALSKRMRLSARLKNLASTVGKNLKHVTKRMSKYKGPTSTSTMDTPEPTFSSYVLSSNSFESMDATMLSTWLFDQQRKQTEYEKISPKEMTLDEYEEKGSWTHLPQSALPTVDRFALLDGSPPLRKSRSELLPKFRLQSSSLVTCSPRVASLNLNEDNLKGTLSARDREMSMPGGWTFG